jgi:hypothetical protein
MAFYLDLPWDLRFGGLSLAKTYREKGKLNL